MATETNRALIPLTNEHFAAWCLKMVGQPYWYGCVVYKCSESLRARKAAQYPAHYGTSRTARYRQDIAAQKVTADCIGAVKGYMWTNGGMGVLESIGTGKTFANHYGSNGCPDKSANGMFAYAKSKGMDWGKIGTVPEIVGLALYKSGHVGYYVGNGYAVEWKGFAYGCVKTKVAGRGWEYWYRLPFIKYGVVSAPGELGASGTTSENGAKKYDFGTRLLRFSYGKKLLKGNDVLAIQTRLMALGFNPGKLDGAYGPKTAASVVAFQRARKIIADGEVGSITRSELKKD